MKAQPMPQGLTLTPSNPHIRSARSLPFTVALAFYPLGLSLLASHPSFPLATPDPS